MTGFWLNNLLSDGLVGLGTIRGVGALRSSRIAFLRSEVLPFAVPAPLSGTTPIRTSTGEHSCCAFPQNPYGWRVGPFFSSFFFSAVPPKFSGISGTGPPLRWNQQLYQINRGPRTERTRRRRNRPARENPHARRNNITNQKTLNVARRKI